MEQLITHVFWVGLCVLVGTYAGYPVLIYLLSKLAKIFRKQELTTEVNVLPAVTFVIAAYNEEKSIREKINDTLDLDYPIDKVQIFVVTDGSDDTTPDIVKEFSSVRLFHLPERRGKIHAVNRVMPYVDTPVVIFSDANTLLNKMALRKMVRHYQDENVGGVAGEKRIAKKSSDVSAVAGEGLYWCYESFIKKCDSNFNSIVGAAGELFSMRTKLFEPPSANTIIEDFYVSMRVVSKGYRFVYEPDAFATETGSATIKEEWKRKVRISAGGLQAIIKLFPLMNPFRFGAISFQYIFHRVMRWTLAPLSLLLVLVCSLALALMGIPFYQWLFALQLIFYLAAFIGYLLKERKLRARIFIVPFYFVMMNLAVYAGAMRFLWGTQSVVWEKSRRAG